MEFLPSARVLIVAPYMLALIVDDRIGLGVIGDNSCATCSGIFFNNAGQNSDPHQGKCKNKNGRNYHRHPDAVGRFSALGSPLCIV